MCSSGPGPHSESRGVRRGGGSTLFPVWGAFLNCPLYSEHFVHRWDGIPLRALSTCSFRKARRQLLQIFALPFSSGRHAAPNGHDQWVVLRSKLKNDGFVVQLNSGGFLRGRHRKNTRVFLFAGGGEGVESIGDLCSKSTYILLQFLRTHTKTSADVTNSILRGSDIVDGHRVESMSPAVYPRNKVQPLFYLRNSWRFTCQHVLLLSSSNLE